MIDAYHMITVSLIASAILGLSLLIYRFVYPKKRINLFYLLILLMILPLISILRKGSYQSGDLSLHVKYAMQFFDNIAQGNLIPRWIGNHCASYGCPEYIFIFFSPYYIISIFHFIGLSFLGSVKLLLIASFILSGVGMYYWIKDELGEKSGFVAAIFYLFAPYHLIDLHFRVSIGELVSMAILPFLFLSTKRWLDKKNSNYFLFTALLFAFLILSHQATALVASPFVLIYGMLKVKISRKNLIGLALITAPFIIGGLIATFYWLPILSESKYIFYGHIDQIDFHPFLQFFYSPHRFGLLFQGHMGELYTSLGYSQWAVIAFAIYLFFKKKVKASDKPLLLFSLISFFILFFMMTKISNPVWNLLYFLKNIQFSWRLLIEATFFVSVIAGIVIKYINNKVIVFLLVFFTIFYTILNWGNRQTEPQINDTVLRNQAVFTDNSSVELTTPYWVHINFDKTYQLPQGHIQILSGKAEIRETKRLQTVHSYIINAQTNVEIKENTFYYTGWTVTANEMVLKLNYNNPKYPGVITFKLPKGKYLVDLEFKNTNDRIIGKMISGISLILLITLFIYFKLVKPQRR